MGSLWMPRTAAFLLRRGYSLSSVLRITGLSVQELVRWYALQDLAAVDRDRSEDPAVSPRRPDGERNR